jgi:LAS superfamily LD-carboxypeptidase LdcB
MPYMGGDIIARIIQATQGNLIDLPGGNVMDWPGSDPVGRITDPEDDKPRGASLFDAPEAKKAEFFTDPAPIHTTAEGQAESAEVRDNPELAKLASQQTQTYTQQSWFSKMGGGPNGDLSGFIPESALAPIEGGNHFMRPDAAKAWKAMDRAARKDGIDISITDSYRTYDAQVALHNGPKGKAGLAATPGHSNHGWGLANDVNVNDPAVYKWLRNNGKRFGFNQPMSYEPWHWEYEGSGEFAVKQARRTPKQKGTKQTQAAPEEVTVNSLINPSIVFGSVIGEVQERSPTSKKDYDDHTSSGGIGFVPKRYRSIIKEAAEAHGVSPRLIAFVMQKESSFNPKAVSSAGAQGLMQIMPLHGLKNPFNVRENVMAGARILAGYINQMGSLRLGLAAYNGGPGNYQAGLGYADDILDDFLGRRAA